MFLSDGVAITGSIDTFADRTPLLADANYYPSGTSIPLAGMWAAYSAIYKRQVWVNTIIRKLAFGTSRLPQKVRQKTARGSVDIPGSPFARLMRRPNPRMSGFKLWLWTSSTFDIYGEAIWVKLRDDKGVVRELHPLHPTNVVIWRDSRGEWGPEGGLWYIYSAGVRNASLLPPIPETDVVHFMNYNPENITRGLSNLEALRSTLFNDDAMRRGSAGMWLNGLRPSMMLQHPKNLSQPAIDRLRKQAQDKHGGVDNWGGAMVLEEGMTANVVQLNAEEMQYIDGRALNRDETCSALDVPPPVVHILDKATFSNITEQMRSMYRDTQAPRLGLFESTVDHDLRPDFDPTEETEFTFDLEGVLRGDFEARATAIAPLVQAAVFKPSEARPLFGLDDAGPDADKLYANAALVPLGSSVAKPPATATDGSPIPQVVEAIAPKPVLPAKLTNSPTVRALMGRVSRKAKAQADQTLIDAHAKAMNALFAKQQAAVAAAIAAMGDDTDLADVDPNQVFDADDWNDELSDTLSPLAEATAKTAGSRVAKLLGGTFDATAIAGWLATNVGYAAQNINAATGAAVGQALQADEPTDALDALFGDDANARADQIAGTRVNSVSNFAGHASATQNGAATKTWRVNSGNPRPSHSDMDGESVGIDEAFSNGMQYPGDPSADVSEIAGCDCSTDFAKGDDSGGDN